MKQQTVSRNAVERKMAELNLRWLEVSEDKEKRIFIWRSAENSVRLVQGFFALQEAGQSEFSLPDMFISAGEPFDISYSYINAVAESFAERAALTELPEPRWTPLLPCWQPRDLIDLLESFLQHYKLNYRYLVILLQPSSIISETAFHHFIENLSAMAVESRVRFALRDTQEDSVWQNLVDNYPGRVELVDIDISEDELARQILNETPTTDGSDMLRFRQLMTDTFISLRSGSLEETINSGQKALNIAVRKGMPEQQVVMLNLMAGAWMKSNDLPKAIEYYVAAQAAAEQSPPESRDNLLTQALLAEGNVWYKNKEPLQASERYLRSALSARKIPSRTMEMEGFRMAGFSLLDIPVKLSAAADHYCSALQAALAMNDEERATSNMMQIFRDILHWLEPEALLHCNKLADEYRQQQSQLICGAQKRIMANKKEDMERQIAECDRNLLLAMEKIFEDYIEKRENLLSRNKRDYQDILAVARYYSHPFWSPGVEIAHPADLPSSCWGVSNLVPVPKAAPDSAQIREFFLTAFMAKEESGHAEKE